MELCLIMLISTGWGVIFTNIQKVHRTILGCRTYFFVITFFFFFENLFLIIETPHCCLSWCPYSRHSPRLPDVHKSTVGSLCLLGDFFLHLCVSHQPLERILILFIYYYLFFIYFFKIKILLWIITSLVTWIYALNMIYLNYRYLAAASRSRPRPQSAYSMTPSEPNSDIAANTSEYVLARVAAAEQEHHSSPTYLKRVLYRCSISFVCSFLFC